MNARSVGANPIACPDFGIGTWYTHTLTRLTFTTADGTEYEFRDALTNGAVNTTTFCNPNNLQPLRRGRVWVCGDGSAASFISDFEFYDNPFYVGEFSGPLLANGSLAPITGYLLMRDGTRYRIENNKVTWIRDANGNKVSVSPTLITDSLNRTFRIATDANGNKTISFEGFDGTTRQIKIWRAPLHALLRSDFPLPVKTYSQLFTALSPNNSQFDVTLVSAVELPDGRQYQFRYNYYGELAKAILPTGGSYEYDWEGGPGAGAEGLVWYTVGYVTGYENYINVYRRVKEKRIFSIGTTLEGKTVFTPLFESGETDPRPWTTTVKVEEKDAGNLVLGASTHLFKGSPKGSFISFPFDYSEWDTAKEYRTDVHATDSATVLQRIFHTWQNAPGAPIIPAWQNWHPYSRNEPPNNARDVEVETSLREATPNQVSKRTSINPSTGAIGFDQYNNPTDVWEYDYGSGAPGILLRHTSTQYITSGYDIVAGTAINPDIAATVHIRSLPVLQSIYDAGGTLRAQTDYEYDNYNQAVSDVFHHSLINRLGIVGFDSSFTTLYYKRGNVTMTTRSQLDTNGDVTGSISGYAQYDIAGNLVTAIDPRSTTTNIIATTFAFSDSFGTPDGEARTNPGPTNLTSGQSSYAFPTLVTNPLGHTAYTQYDYYLGMPVDSEDTNHITSSAFYGDLLDRPTEVWRDVVGGVAYSKTRFVYNDISRTISTQNDQTSVGDFAQQSLIKYDGLGRTIRKAAYEGDTGGTNTWAIVDTQFDGLGRIKQTSNPFRDTAPVTATTPSGIWTTTAYDALSRVLTVTAPDGAIVTTSYTNNLVLVTDPSGKQRMSKTEGLGRLTDIWEIRSADAVTGTEAVTFPGHAEVSAGYRTKYSYDVLDDLTEVKQQIGTTGTTQTRTFQYDSLKRLTSAFNPESGTVSYTYDNNSNLLTKTDSRFPAVTTTYSYDELNRIKDRTYSESTPAVAYKYDAQPLPPGAPGTSSFDRGYSKGRLVAVTYGGSSTGNYTGYDRLGRANVSYQQTDSQNYGFTYAYNLADEMTSEKYPSGKEIRTTYDVAGRVTDVKRYINDVFDKTYASQFSYTAHGDVSGLQLGNSKWEHTNFNSRLQPTEIGLGASTGASDLLKLEYTYSNSDPSIHDNNGNVLTQKITAPKIGSGNLVLTQLYTYDATNRLLSASENGSPTWAQTYDYDRFGNRAVRSGSYFPTPRQTPTSNSPSDLPQLFSQSNNRIIASTDYLHDPAGNLTSMPHKVQGNPADTMTYDAENRQKSYSPAGATAVNYSYDGDGRRVKKVVPGNPSVTTLFVYNVLGRLIAEYTSDPVPPPAGGGGTSYLTNDHLGSTRVLTRQDGTVKARYDYLPFGEEIDASKGGRDMVTGYGGPDSTRQKFTQKERDNESGLDYFVARYYSSAQGRFTSIDPVSGQEKVPQSWNRYTYTLNNPLKYLDPDGLEWRKKHEDNTVKWYNDHDDRAGTTEIQPNEYGVLTYQSGDRIVILNPKGPQGWFGIGQQVSFTNNFFFDQILTRITVADDYTAIGWTTVSADPAIRNGAVYDAPEDIIGAVALGQGLLGLGRGIVGRGASVNLYRGVPKGHEFFEDALEGTARPFGGHADPVLHNTMDTHSVFTSWTTDRSVAVEFAGKDGVVLQRSFTRSQLIRSPDLKAEGEHLVRGPVTGAKVTKP